MHHSYRDSRSSLWFSLWSLWSLFGLSPKPSNWSSILSLLASFFFLFFFSLYPFFLVHSFAFPSILLCMEYTQPPCSNLPRPRASRQPPFSPFFAGRRRTYMLAHPHSPSPRITRFCNLLTLNLTYYWIWYGSQDWTSLSLFWFQLDLGFTFLFWVKSIFFSYLFFFLSLSLVPRYARSTSFHCKCEAGTR